MKKGKIIIYQFKLILYWLNSRREVKNFRAQYPGLRLSQLKEIMYKEFQKSPDNPFNQSNVFSYNSTLEEVNRKLSMYNRRIYVISSN